ncbi:MAG: DUF222 domain-containing protein [Acidimicrobiia bacterium]|nr:DUF222 domain-containing protein [Acidimicrobiia bacterium]
METNIDNLAEAIRGLTDAIRELDAEGMSVDELAEGIPALTVLMDRAEAARLGMVGEFDRRGGADVTAHTSTTSWLKDRCDISGSTAREKVRVARALRLMPLTEAAFGDGRLGYSHVRELTRCHSAHPDVFGDHEETLVDVAGPLSVRDLRRALDHWRQTLDGPGVLDELEEQHGRRRLWLSEAFEGMIRMDGDIDPDTAEPIRVALDAICDRDARASTDDHRTQSQKRADALSEICRQWLDGADTPQIGGERPHLDVLVDVDVLSGWTAGAGETTGGRVVHPEVARRLACDASVSRIVLAGDSEPLDVGRRTRVVPAGMRRALVARDRGCRFPGCDRPPRWCDAHHIIHWIRNGPTSLYNLVLLCRRHHRIVHEGRWQVLRDQGDITFIYPNGIEHTNSDRLISM